MSAFDMARSMNVDSVSSRYFVPRRSQPRVVRQRRNACAAFDGLSTPDDWDWQAFKARLIARNGAEVRENDQAFSHGCMRCVVLLRATRWCASLVFLSAWPQFSVAVPAVCPHAGLPTQALHVFSLTPR